MTAVAVIGAGVAGAGAATVLDRAGLAADVIERLDRIGGRAASRTRDDVVYDYGANYLKADDDRVTALVTDELDTAGLVDITEPVWTIDAHGAVAPGRDTDEHKWTFEAGLAELTRRLLDRTSIPVDEGRTVATLVRDGQGWALRMAGGGRRGPYEAVVLTPPAPVAADLINASGNPEPIQMAADRMAAVPYRSIYSAVLHYPFEIDRPYYALVDTSGEHVISWLARESCKPGHIPENESVLIVQASHDWTIAHGDEPSERIESRLASHAAALLDDDRLAAPDWTDGCRWSSALPDAELGTDVRESVRAANVYLAGDAVAGAGRIHAALRSGLEAGDRLVTDYNSPS